MPRRYLGDEIGNLRCFDISLILALLQLGLPDENYRIQPSADAPIYKGAMGPEGERPLFAADIMDNPPDAPDDKVLTKVRRRCGRPVGASRRQFLGFEEELASRSVRSERRPRGRPCVKRWASTRPTRWRTSATRKP